MHRCCVFFFWLMIASSLAIGLVPPHLTILWQGYGLLMAISGLGWVLTWQYSRHSTFRPPAFKRIIIPVILYAMVLLWALVQSMPIAPQSNLAFMVHPAWQMLSVADIHHKTGHISVAPYATVQWLMEMLLYALLFFAVAVMTASRKRAALLLYSFVFAAMIYALAGIGTFLNAESVWKASSLAIFIGIGCVTAIGLLIRLYRDNTRFRRLQIKPVAPLAFRGRRALIVVLYIAFIILLAVLLLLQSRLAVAVTALSALAVVAFSLRSKRYSLFAKTILAGCVGGFVGLLVLGSLPLLYGVFQQRATEEAAGFGAYTLLWQAVLEQAKTGHGVGAASFITPLYQSDIPYWNEAASNEYMLLLLGAGVPVAIIFIAIFLVLAGILVIRITQKISRNRLFPLLAVAVLLLLALHAVVAPTFQIFGVAAWLAILLGAGYGQAYRRA